MMLLKIHKSVYSEMLKAGSRTIHALTLIVGRENTGRTYTGAIIGELWLVELQIFIFLTFAVFSTLSTVSIQLEKATLSYIKG